MTIEELRVLITAETKDLKKQVDGVKKQLSGLEKHAKNTSTKMSNMFKNLFKGFTVAAIVAGLVKVGRAAISMASNLEEVQNVVDVSFG